MDAARRARSWVWAAFHSGSCVAAPLERVAVVAVRPRVAGVRGRASPAPTPAATRSGRSRRRCAAALKPSSRQVTSWSRNASAPRRDAPPALALAAAASPASLRRVQPSCGITASKTSCAERWPKCRYGDRPLAASSSGIVAIVGVGGEVAVDERRQPGPRRPPRRRASRPARRRDRSAGAASAPARAGEQRRRRRAASAPSTGVERGRRRQADAGQRIGARHVVEVRRAASSAGGARNANAVGKARSAARSGSRPLPSTASRRTSGGAAAAATMRGRKKPGKSSVTTTAALAASASSSPRPSPGAGST